jgi:hypothetical protein
LRSFIGDGQIGWDRSPHAAATSWSSARTVLALLLLVVGAALPWLVPAGLVGLGARYFIKRRRAAAGME